MGPLQDERPYCIGGVGGDGGARGGQARWKNINCIYKIE